MIEKDGMISKPDEDKLVEEKLKTPYFIIDKKELDKNIYNLENALNTYWNNYIIGYSIKTNSLPWLVNYFMNRNVYAEVVSDDEYHLASEIGFESKKFIFNGLIKSKETFFQAICNGCIVNIESHQELQWLKELDNFCKSSYGVGIRVNFDLEKYCPNESEIGSRFGFCYENGELKKAVECINALENIRLIGLHLHFSTKTRSLNIYRAISEVACEIKEAYGLNLKYVDVGGGFFGGLQDKPQFSDYLQVISSELGKSFDKENTVLVVEPGTSLISSPVSFVTSVTDVKQTISDCFIVTDGSRIDVDPLMSKSRYYYSIEYKNNDKRQSLKSQVITGFTCMENDRLFILENSPQLLSGDKIIYEKVGAYTMCLSPLFIRYYPAVYVRENMNILEVRDKWTYEEFMQKNKLRDI